MKTKGGVVLAGLNELMGPGLKVAEKIYRNYGPELVITSGLEGEHSAGSKHYCGKAVDLRTRFFTEKEKEAVYGRLVKELWLFYRIIKHKTHLHIEFRF